MSEDNLDSSFPLQAGEIKVIKVDGRGQETAREPLPFRGNQHNTPTEEPPDTPDPLTSAEAARLFEIMGRERVAFILRSMRPEIAACVLDHIHPRIAAKCLQIMTWKEAARTLDHMNPEAAAFLLKNTDLKAAVRVLENMQPEAAVEVIGTLEATSIALVFDMMHTRALLRLFNYARPQIITRLLGHVKLPIATRILKHLPQETAGKIVGVLDTALVASMLDRMDAKTTVHILDQARPHITASLLECMDLEAAIHALKYMHPKTAGKVIKAMNTVEVAALILEHLNPKVTAYLIDSMLEDSQEIEGPPEDLPEDADTRGDKKKQEKSALWHEIAQQLIVGYTIGGLNNIFPSMLAHHWLWGPFATGGVASTLANYALKKLPYPASAFAQTFIGQTVTISSYFLSLLLGMAKPPKAG